jgi:hypothetical protein
MFVLSSFDYRMRLCQIIYLINKALPLMLLLFKICRTLYFYLIPPRSYSRTTKRSSFVLWEYNYRYTHGHLLPSSYDVCYRHCHPKVHFKRVFPILTSCSAASSYIEIWRTYIYQNWRQGKQTHIDGSQIVKYCTSYSLYERIWIM